MSVVETLAGLGRTAPRPLRKPRRGEDGGRYALRFGVTALILIAGTLVLVLVVLPERYVLRPGFRESGMTFPDPTTPFDPLPATSVPARPLLSPPPIPIAGPREALWDDVLPLVDAGDYAAVLLRLDRYLLDYPNDLDVRRERAVALVAQGRADEAIDELRTLVALTDAFADRLVLARTLRDVGRTSEAAAEYARLAAARPDDEGLALERAQAYAWARLYGEAAAVLEEALARVPESARLRVELARVYYESGRLVEARALLASLAEPALASASGSGLRDDVQAALAVPPPTAPVPPTLLEQAVAAREADDFVRARELFEQARRESPGSEATWQAYADLLEYELDDVEGALGALLEVERLRSESAADRGAPSADADLQYRLARLEIWTGRNADAEARLESLLARMEEGVASGATSEAEIEAALGDLRRWQGDRLGAAERYASALRGDPQSARALAGFAALEAEVERTVLEVERPRAGGIASSLSDTDDFDRVDLGGEWVGTRGRWAWGGVVGNRWISGTALDASPARLSGEFVELKGARWWRWGTVRTGLDFGAERLGSSWQLAAGLSLSHRGSNGRSQLRVDHGPAYPMALTLQSVLAGVEQQRVAISHARFLDAAERWSVAMVIEGARLVADTAALAPASASSSLRLQASLEVGRALTSAIAVGFSASSAVLTRAAPRALLPDGGTRPLFWDPKLVVAGGPYAQLGIDLTRSWRATARAAPGIALIEERSAMGFDVVPHLVAEAGLRREAGRFSVALDLFYSQGRFDGYRAYGARLSVGALGLGGSTGGP